MTLFGLWQLIKQNRTAAVILIILLAGILIVTFGLVQQSCQRRADENENKRLKQIEQNANSHQREADNARDNRIFDQGAENEKQRQLDNLNGDLRNAANDSNRAQANLNAVRNGNYRNVSANELEQKSKDY